MAEWRPGDSASFTKTFTEDDLLLYADVTGDTNPLHMDEDYARAGRFGQRIVHGMLVAGLISTVLGTKLPGPGVIYATQSLQFIYPVFIGDTVTATVTIATYDRVHGHIRLTTTCHNQQQQAVLAGEALMVYRQET